MTTLLVNIQQPPQTGGLDLFHLYVALSQGSGRSVIRLLQEFDGKLFQATCERELLAEDDRFEEPNGKALTW